MGRLLGNITNPNLISRYAELCPRIALVVDNAKHPSGTKLPCGTLLAKQTSNSKYRAYAEALVATGGDFSTASPDFNLDPTGVLAGYFQVGDVIESVGGDSLGTIATYDPTTGAGTLTGNSAHNLAAAGSVRLRESTNKISGKAGSILETETLMEDTDKMVDGFIEGFFTQSRTTVTAAALATMGGHVISTDEIRLV